VANYRLFPSTSGPALTSYTGKFMAGVAFQVTEGATWLSGFWWWVPAGGDTAAQEFCLWQLTAGLAGIVVPATTVTSGTLTAGAWNYVALASPVGLTPGIPYLAETAYTAAHGFPETHGQFGSGDPYSAGITNGPLSAYSDASGSNPAPSGWVTQGSFGTAYSVPTSGIPNLGSDSSSNFWLDVQVTDTLPAGGSYRLWPSLPLPQGMIQDSAANFTLATEFVLSGSCSLDNIWFYSPSGAPNLPTECGILGQTSQALVSGTHVTSPSWSGAAGSGWVAHAYTGVTLPAGAYRVAVANSDGTAGAWNDATVDYFLTGAGSAGLTAGPLSAPPNSTAGSPGQGSYNSGATLAWPGTFDTGHAPSYWVDVEVTPGATIDSGSAALAALPSLAAAGTRTVLASAHVTAASSLSAPGTRAVPAAAALSAPGALSAHGTLSVRAAASAAALARLSAAGAVPVTAGAALGASAVLTCSYLPARIVIAANIMFPDNQSGIYGASEAETTVIVPGVTDGIYSS